MKLTVPHRYLQTQTFTREVHTMADVVKVKKSSDGFKTNTGTIRSCEECRGERAGERSDEWSGARPWPRATWLLTCAVWGEWRSFQLALCSDHFHEMRGKARVDRVPETEFGVDVTPYLPEEGWDLTDPRITGTYEMSGFQFSSEDPPPGPPWEQQNPPLGRA